MYFQPRKYFFVVSQWQKTLPSMSSLGLGSLVSISRTLLFLMAFLALSLTKKLGWMKLFFMLLPTIGFLLKHVFRFNRIELCSTIKEFATIMGELEIIDLIFPMMGGDLPSLLRVVMGILETTTNRWCVFRKLNLRLVLDYCKVEFNQPHVSFIPCQIFL